MLGNRFFVDRLLSIALINIQQPKSNPIKSRIKNQESRIKNQNESLSDDKLKAIVAYNAAVSVLNRDSPSETGLNPLSIAN